MTNEYFLSKEDATYLDYWKNGHRQKYIKVCANCQKEFNMYPTSSELWCYKNCLGYSRNFFCTWNCQVAFEKKHNKTR